MNRFVLLALFFIIGIAQAGMIHYALAPGANQPAVKDCCPEGKCCPDGKCCPTESKTEKAEPSCCSGAKPAAKVETAPTPKFKCRCNYCHCSSERGGDCYCTEEHCNDNDCACPRLRK